jgi:aryl-phospho-beta-D-glucosidase BglC (GH1 family)
VGSKLEHDARPVLLLFMHGQAAVTIALCTSRIAEQEHVMRTAYPKSAAIGLMLAIACCVRTATAQQSAEDIAVRRAAALTRGVSLSGWFGGWGDYSPEHTSTYITAADFQVMKGMGIRYVRFPLDPTLLSQGGLRNPNKDQIWARIDSALDMAMDSGMAVDFVVFPRDDYKQRLATQSGADQFIMLWQVLAKHFVGRDPDRFFFELMNESEEQDPYRWVGLESATAKAIRDIDAEHTILASGAHYDSLGDLLTTQTIDDPNVIYTFHFYEPYAFTHQGASWGSVEWNYFRDIPYPATPGEIADRIKSIPDNSARYQLYLYGAEGWNAASILHRIAFAAEWGRERHVPVVCNEFGAFRDTAPPDSRARYLHDVRTALEQNGIGWAMWDWSGNFGLVTHQANAIMPDRLDVDALGLKQP